MSQTAHQGPSAFPYPGLRPFRREESEIFFGRDEQTDQLLEKLGQTRFLAIVGPSGCGKSSLVRAGMIAALETGFMAEAGARWRVAEMRPGTRPLAQLAATLLEPSALGSERGSSPEAVALLGAVLRRGPLGLIEILRETPLPEQTNLLILIDQFEEIFRYRMQGGANEADAFVALLLATKSQREFPVYVVITMRSDFLGDCAVFPGMPEAINESQFLTPRLSWEQRKQAITGPAETFEGELDPALVNCLLNESGSDPDQLPLLQHALMRIWTRASMRHAANPSEKILATLADYRAKEIEGLAKCLSNHADEAFEELTDRQKHLAEVLFRSLCERSVNRRDTRRPVELGVVANIARATLSEMGEVVDVFRRPDCNFLTPSAGVPLAADTIIDISHESLIRHWERMNEWVDQEAKSAEIYRRLAQTARLWKAGEAALWSTPDLENALDWKLKEKPTPEWASRYSADFQLALEFLAESKAAHDKRIAREEKARRDAFKKQWLLWYAAAGIAVALVFGASMWELRNRASSEASNKVFSAEQQARAIAETAREEKNQAAAEKLHAVEEKNRTLVETWNIGAEQTSSSGELLTAVAYYAAAQELEKRTGDKSKVEWSFLTSLPPPSIRYNGLLSDIPGIRKMAFNSDGTSLALALADARVRIVDVMTGEDRGSFAFGSNGVSLITFDAEAKLLAAVSYETNVLIWDVIGAKRISPDLPSFAEKITALSFNPEGNLLAIGDQGGRVSFIESLTNSPPNYLNGDLGASTAKVWGFSTNKTIRPTEPTNQAVSTLAFKPDDGLLVIFCSKTGLCVNVETTQRLPLIAGASYYYDYYLAETVSAVFSPDGRWLATVTESGRFATWKVAFKSGEMTTSDGTRATTTPTETSVERQERNSPEPRSSQRLASGQALSLEKESSSWLSSIESSERTPFWNRIPGKRVSTRRSNDRIAQPFVFSPSGDFLAFAPDRFINISSLRDVQEPNIFYRETPTRQGSFMRVRAHADQISGLAISPDGKLVASASVDETIRFWEVQSKDERTKVQEQSVTGTSVAFSPSGHLLGAGTRYGRVFNPTDAMLFCNRARAYLKKGNKANALSDYNKAIEIEPENAAFYSGRGNAYAEQGDWLKAIQDYSQAVKLEPRDSLLYHSRGILYRNQRAWENALKDFSQALSLAPTGNDYVQRGRTYKLKGELENARADFAKALNISEEPKHDVTRGFANALLGEFDEALKDFHRALEAKPGDVETMFYLARFYAIRAASYPKNEEGEKSESADIEKAIGTLEEVILKKGYTDWPRSASAMDFEILRNNDRFQRLVNAR